MNPGQFAADNWLYFMGLLPIVGLVLTVVVTWAAVVGIVRAVRDGG